MTTILFAFIFAFALSLALTPLAKRLGTRFGAVDTPSARKVHTRAIPRSGGLAIAASFFLALLACTLLATDISNLLVWNRQRTFGFLGGLIIFAVGFFDDFHRLGPRIKFLFQVLAASLAFYGGIRIEAFSAGWSVYYFGIMSWVVTVFWFLLFINAVNLIDGLDGLAAGVAFFTSAVMVFLSVMRPDYLVSLEFAALAGALLGFLRYNFNPASVFMGDGGSYFIGYTIATLAILGSIKSQVGATLLIPLLALGVPIFDTILSPLRRWVLGRRMFRPDKGHIHHRLIDMGFSSYKAVLVIYSISFALCLVAILMVNLRNEVASLLLVVLGAGAFIIVRKLGYLEYFAIDKLYGWLQDISDATGISQDRRSFLSLQIEMDRSRSMEELWGNICLALDRMQFDRCELHHREPTVKTVIAGNPAGPAEPATTGAYAGSDRRQGAPGRGGKTIWTNEMNDGMGHLRVWARGHHRRGEDVRNNGMLRVEIPLGKASPSASKLVLIKDLTQEPVHPNTLRRIEYLRRSVTNAINRLYPEPAPASAPVREAATTKPSSSRPTPPLIS